MTAFQEADGDPGLKLNDYLNAAPANRQFAASAMQEMCEGVAILLHKDPKYAGFVRGVYIDRYLEVASRAIPTASPPPKIRSAHPRGFRADPHRGPFD